MKHRVSVPPVSVLVLRMVHMSGAVEQTRTMVIVSYGRSGT